MSAIGQKRSLAAVASITKLELLGCSHGFLDDTQLEAPMDTTIITSTSVERCSLPPDFTLMTDPPITAQPAMPPLKPVAMLATPGRMYSRSLLLLVSVISSTMVAVIKYSSRPTITRRIGPLLQA